MSTTRSAVFGRFSSMATVPFVTLGWVLRSLMLAPGGDDLARRGAGVLPVGEDASAVDPDVADADRAPVGLLEGGAVGDRGGVEGDDVGLGAGAEQAAVADTEA